MAEKEKSLGFSIFYDKERAQAFNFMSNMALEELYRHPELRDDPDARKYVEAISKIIDDFGEPFHELGWCEDPHCQYEKK